MQISGISLFVLLLPISAANESLTVNCEGDPIKLSCLVSNSLIKDEVNTLWKKSSGEIVIWNYHGDNNTGDTFKNRRVQLNKDFSLTIGDCSQSDQGRYVLCINGKPSCYVKLLVKASKHCNRTKPVTEQSTTRSTIYEKSIQDATDDLQTESSLPRDYIKWGVCVAACLFVLVVLQMAVCVYIQRTKSKNDKTEFKQLSTNTQNNKV